MKTRTIEIDATTAEVLERRAAARGVSVRELVSELLQGDADWPDDLDAMRRDGRGPWSPQVLAEDARRWEEFERSGEGVPWEEVDAWLRSWGTANELPPPKPRKL